MDDWDPDLPIYLQVRRKIADMILDGIISDGAALPSVRTIANDYRLNPLTVLRAFQVLEDESIVEKRRGLGIFVRDGGSERLRNLEREAFLTRHWPRIRRTIERLGLDPRTLFDDNHDGDRST